MTEAWDPNPAPAVPPPQPGDRRFPLGLTLAVAIATAILVALGVWQLQRLKWKEDLLAHVAALQSAAPQPLGPALERLAKGEDVNFTRVTVACPGLATAPFLELYAVRGGQAGWRLISACAVAAGPYRTILVDRGFVADTVSARPPADGGDRRPVALQGVLRAPEGRNPFTPRTPPSLNRWFARDPETMALALKAPNPAPTFLMAETSTNPDWKALVPSPLPAEIPNRHLEYALTWFGLAAALLGVYAAMLWRRWKD